MRSIFTLAGLLIVMVVVLILATRQTRRDLDAVRSVTLATQQSGVAAQPFDAVEASRLAQRLRDLTGWPQPPQDELREAAARAAAWAAGLVPGTADYHTAVNLRGAADELRAASESLADPHRVRARQLLERAQSPPGGPGGGPPGAIGGIRDKLQDLQQSHQEQLQDVEQEQH